MHIFSILSTDLMSLFKDSYTPSPVPILLEVMFNVRDWLKPVNPQLHNIPNPHIFVLRKNTTGAVVLKYKQWSRDDDWLPANETGEGGFEILKEVYYCTIPF